MELPPLPGVTKFPGRAARLLHLDTDPRRPWVEHDPLRDPFQFAACHWGQLKLLYGEIEFLTIAAKTHDLSTCTVVYVGAAPGHSIGLLRRMFPPLHFVLVDPASFVAKQDSHVRILNALFTDELAASIVAEREGTQTILFISDIRLTVDDRDGFESAVFADMLSQQRWCMALNASMAMLKFRLPFTDATKGPRDMRYDYRSSSVTLRKGVPKVPSSVPLGSMVYLDGDVRLQLYPPSDSAETRLIVRRSKGGKFMMRSYDYEAYEETMAYFNTVTRRARFSFPQSNIISKHVAGFDPGSWESASEAWITSEYVKVMAPVTTATDLSMAVTRVIYAIHRDMWEVTHRSVISCKLETPLAASKEEGMRRVIYRLAKIRGRRQLQDALDIVATETIQKAEQQIASFMEMAAQTQPVLLRRIDYLSQITWLRSEISEIRRLHAVYSGLL